MPQTTPGAAPGPLDGPASAPADSGRAVVDAAGRFVSGDRAVFARLGLDSRVDSVVVPAHGRTAWDTGGLDALVRITRDPRGEGRWMLDLVSRPRHPPDRTAISPETVAAFARSSDFAGTITSLSAGFAAASGLTVPIVVLIDPSGAPTFAGGTTQDFRQLAAMERSRRSAAPMAIWQAFEERRLIVDPHWIDTVMTDDRFLAIRTLFPSGVDQRLIYVTIPLRNDRAVVGVVAGFWPDDVPITAADVDLWLTSAEELAFGTHISELLRRAQANGAEAERMRINDDIHAGIAQSIFALSLEIARASAANAVPKQSDLLAIQSMADELSADVRVFLSDARPAGEGHNLARRLQEMVRDLATETGASVIADHRVDWDECSGDFADSVVRMVAEAFRNIAKHASATRVGFRSWMSAETNEVVIEIADDGRAVSEFGPEARPRSSGAGLALIRELAVHWHGRVEFAPTGDGATLTIQVMPEFQSEWAGAQRLLQTGSDDADPETDDRGPVV